MTIPEQIADLLAKHPDPSSRKTQYEIFKKFGVALTYDHFKKIMLQNGYKLPKTLNYFAESATRIEVQKSSVIEKAMRFVNRKREFSRQDFTNYLASVSPMDVTHCPKYAINKLLQNGQIQRVGFSRYQRVEAA